MEQFDGKDILEIMREDLQRKDYSAIATLWEKWVGVSFAAK